MHDGFSKLNLSFRFFVSITYRGFVTIVIHKTPLGKNKQCNYLLHWEMKINWKQAYHEKDITNINCNFAISINRF